MGNARRAWSCALFLLGLSASQALAKDYASTMQFQVFRPCSGNVRLQFVVGCKSVGNQLLSNRAKVEIADVFGEIEECLHGIGVPDPVVTGDGVFGKVQPGSMHVDARPNRLRQSTCQRVNPLASAPT